MKILSGSPRFDIFSETFNNCNQLLNLIKKRFLHQNKKIQFQVQKIQSSDLSTAKQHPTGKPANHPTSHQQQKNLLGIRCIFQFAAKHNSDPTPNKGRPEQVSVEKFSVLDNSKETFQWVETLLCSLEFHLIKILIFADENWVTFRFMQLDNVLCFSEMPEMDFESLLYPKSWSPSDDPLEMIRQKTFPKNSFVERCKNA